MRGVAAICVLILLPALAYAGDFGAVAYSMQTDTVSFVTDEDTRSSAEQSAVAACRESSRLPDSCFAAMWFQNSCGAIATAKDNTWGVGWGDTQDIATGWAMRYCREYGGRDCKLRGVFCSPGGAGYLPANG